MLKVIVALFCYNGIKDTDIWALWAKQGRILATKDRQTMPIELAQLIVKERSIGVGWAPPTFIAGECGNIFVYLLSSAYFRGVMRSQQTYLRITWLKSRTVDGLHKK